MNSESRTVVCGKSVLYLALAAVMVLSAVPTASTARSLYVIAQVTSADFPVPVHAYDIGPDGTLTFQAKYGIPFRGSGVVGLAIDSISESLFVTYEDSDRIQVLDAASMTDVWVTVAPNAKNLAGIVFDHEKGLLYCVDRRTTNLYCYLWNAADGTLTHVPGSPFTLEGAEAYGIALDETNDLLYVANANRTVLVFKTLDWSLVRKITLGTTAISIALDTQRGYMYTGAGFADIYTLTQYNLTTGAVAEVEVSPEAGIMGLGVDVSTGFIYMSTGRNNRQGGDDLLVFDMALRQIQAVENIGNPTGLVIPERETSYNPLHLAKTIVQASGVPAVGDGLPRVAIGSEFRCRICFDQNVSGLTETTVLDVLPREVTFVRADGDGVFGQYDAPRHRYLWRNPPRSEGGRACLEIVLRVKPGTAAGTVITNLATIDTNVTPPTTIGVQAVTTGTSYDYEPLNLTMHVLAEDPDTGSLVPLEIGYAMGGDNVTYRICFDNSANDHAVSNVVLVDVLPVLASFVAAEGGGTVGRYDPLSHTCTWLYPSLGPGDSNSVELKVRLGDSIPADTILSNSAVIVSDQTPEVHADVDVIIGYEPLRLRKTIVSGATEGLDGRLYASAGEELTYSICVGNPSDDKTVTRLDIVDLLPKDLDFVRADADGIAGAYDSNTHTYTWFDTTLQPNTDVCLELTGRVKASVEPNSVITNTVKAIGRQTTPVTTAIEVVVTVRAVQAEMFISPTRLFRNSSPQPTSLMVTMLLPEGVGKDRIANVPLVMSPGSIQASLQYVYGTDTRGKVLAFFDPQQFFAATEGYGLFEVQVTGKLVSGRSFVGHSTISVLRFGGP